MIPFFFPCLPVSFGLNGLLDPEMTVKASATTIARGPISFLHRNCKIGRKPASLYFPALLCYCLLRYSGRCWSYHWYRSAIGFDDAAVLGLGVSTLSRLVCDVHGDAPIGRCEQPPMVSRQYTSLFYRCWDCYGNCCCYCRCNLSFDAAA